MTPLIIDPEWLLKMADKESGGITSVGGLVRGVEAPSELAARLDAEVTRAIESGAEFPTDSAPPKSGRVKVHPELVQGTDEWRAARCGLLTASEMHLIITPKNLEYARNDKARGHLSELLAQRITNYVEPQYVNDDMLRGNLDEMDARNLYREHYAKVQEVGFVTNDKWGFTLGYSPDGLVGEDGTIEVKGRRQKFQVETIIRGMMDDEFLIQVQTGLLVSERRWCDFISYSGGLPMAVIRVEANGYVQGKIVEAATEFHAKIEEKMHDYTERVKASKYIPTTRRPAELEII